MEMYKKQDKKNKKWVGDLKEELSIIAPIVVFFLLFLFIAIGFFGAIIWLVEMREKSIVRQCKEYHKAGMNPDACPFIDETKNKQDAEEAGGGQ